MSSYFIAQINIEDEEVYASYLAGFDDVMSKFKGQVIAVDDEATILEGDWPYGRTVLIRFPDRDELLRWYMSAEYQELAGFRLNSAQANIAAVEGRD